MFFDDFIPGQIDKYGFGMTAGNGRFHFMVALSDGERVRQLCLSRRRDLRRLDGKPVKWFDDESRAVDVFRNNKKACHKCLRAIETIELNLAGVK
ncbi:MAG TPA: hypothetical protein DHV36_14305 [Desulfobacteraceae bacterium]|nr:hypothetical protein [Desulfobacteraceae bacterium]